MRDGLHVHVCTVHAARPSSVALLVHPIPTYHASFLKQEQIGMHGEQEEINRTLLIYNVYLRESLAVIIIVKRKT